MTQHGSFVCLKLYLRSFTPIEHHKRRSGSGEREETKGIISFLFFSSLFFFFFFFFFIFFSSLLFSSLLFFSFLSLHAPSTAFPFCTLLQVSIVTKVEWQCDTKRDDTCCCLHPQVPN